MNIQKAKIENTEVLLVDSVPQSAFPPPDWGYWKQMVPETMSGNEVLLLGIGAGTIARLLKDKFPKVKITGVDNNSTLIMSATNEFGLNEIGMEIVIEDGYEYVKKTKKRFDLIIVDMWNGYWFPIKSLSKEFIEDLKNILNDKGEVRINTPNLDYSAKEITEGLEAYRDDIGRNVIYRFNLTKEKK